MAWEAADQSALPLTAVSLPHGGLLIQRFHGDLAEEDPQESAGPNVRRLHSARLGRYGNSSHTHACAHTAIPCSGLRAWRPPDYVTSIQTACYKSFNIPAMNTQTRRLSVWVLVSENRGNMLRNADCDPWVILTPNQLLLNGLLSHTWYHVHRPTAKVTTSPNVTRLNNHEWHYPQVAHFVPHHRYC